MLLIPVCVMTLYRNSTLIHLMQRHHSSWALTGCYHKTILDCLQCQVISMDFCKAQRSISITLSMQPQTLCCQRLWLHYIRQIGWFVAKCCYGACRLCSTCTNDAVRYNVLVKKNISHHVPAIYNGFLELTELSSFSHIFL